MLTLILFYLLVDAFDALSRLKGIETEAAVRSLARYAYLSMHFPV